MIKPTAMKTASIRITTFLLLLLTAQLSYSQCGPLSTPNVTNNGQSGIMFDVVAITPVEITQLGMDFDNGVYNMEIYVIPGTHVGNEQNAAAWTLLGTTNGWTGTTGSNNLIPITFSQVLCPGESVGFYVTASNSTNGNYSNGTGVGNVIVNDGNISILQGTGKAYPFANSFTPRVPNVTVLYNCLAACCTPPVMSSSPETCLGACDGTATATVGAGGIPPFTYQWDAAAGNQTTQTATGLCAGTYTVDVTDGTGCVASGTVTVTSGAAAANPTITPAGPFCVSDTPSSLIAVDPGGTWSGNGITDPVNGIFDPAVAGVGTHTITYTITGACGASDTETIVVNADADATITPVGPFCDTEPAFNLNATDPGGTWSGLGIVDAVNGTFDAAAAGAGTHTITYSIPGPCGDTQTTTITVNAISNATINPAGPFCESDAAINVTAATAGGSWSGNGITDPVNGTFDPATAGVGAHTITYTITGSCGSSDTEVVTVNADLDATITAVGPFCDADPAINLNAVDPGGSWSGNGITDAVNGTFDPAVAGVGTHTITYTISGPCGDVQTVDIVINNALDATITPVGPFCVTDPSLSLTAVDNGGTWSGVGVVDALNGIFDPAVAGAGTHTVTYTIAGACGDVQTTDIVVNPSEDATITALGTVCLGSVNTLSAVTAGGTWSGPGITNAVNGVFDASVAGTGTHTITYTTNGPCPDVATIDIQVLPPLNVQAIANVTSICDGEVVNLSATGAGGDGSLNYIWTDQAGSIVGNGPNITVTPSTTTTYTVTLSDGCSTPVSSDDVAVVVYPIPTVNIVADNQFGCTPLEVNFTNASSPVGSNCYWDFGNGENSSSCGTASSIYTVPGCYDVTLTVEENGCSNSVVLNDFICVADQPQANFSFTPNEGTIFETTFEFTNQSQNADIFTWDFDDGTISSAVDPTHVYEEVPGGYLVCLTASNAYGCFDSICQSITIVEDVVYYVPNSFTPDGDEFNQTFQPVFTSGYDPYNFVFRIYNRWGELIWETQDASIGWDGTYGGNQALVQSGTYVWTVEFKIPSNDGKVTDRGHVNVIR
jgi:gliding motility-associated-like protein